MACGYDTPTRFEATPKGRIGSSPRILNTVGVPLNTGGGRALWRRPVWGAGLPGSRCWPPAVGAALEQSGAALNPGDGWGVGSPPARMVSPGWALGLQEDSTRRTCSAARSGGGTRRQRWVFQAIFDARQAGPGAPPDLSPGPPGLQSVRWPTASTSPLDSEVQDALGWPATPRSGWSRIRFPWVAGGPGRPQRAYLRFRPPDSGPASPGGTSCSRDHRGLLVGDLTATLVRIRPANQLLVGALEWWRFQRPPATRPPRRRSAGRAPRSSPAGCGAVPALVGDQVLQSAWCGRFPGSDARRYVKSVAAWWRNADCASLARDRDGERSVLDRSGPGSIRCPRYRRRPLPPPGPARPGRWRGPCSSSRRKVGLQVLWVPPLVPRRCRPGVEVSGDGCLRTSQGPGGSATRGSGEAKRRGKAGMRLEHPFHICWASSIVSWRPEIQVRILRLREHPSPAPPILTQHNALLMRPPLHIKETPPQAAQCRRRGQEGVPPCAWISP